MSGLTEAGREGERVKCGRGGSLSKERERQGERRAGRQETRGAGGGSRRVVGGDWRKGEGAGSREQEEAPMHHQIEIDGSNNIVIGSILGGNLRHDLVSLKHAKELTACALTQNGKCLTCQVS